jgi:hypothetical protein
MANEEIAWINRIRKDSKLEGISVGEKIELIGIACDHQQQQGRVVFYDGNANLMLVSTRASPEEIHVRSYFLAPDMIETRGKMQIGDRIKAGSYTQIVKKDCVDYVEHDNNLKEVGL